MMIHENIKIINEKIENALNHVGRSSGDVKLMAVSKFNPQESVLEAIEAGQFLFGENRVQEATEKFKDILINKQNVSLHLIGSLQRNKVKQIIPYVDCIQSVDRVDLIAEIEKQCSLFYKTQNQPKRKLKVFLEYHTAEDSKSGFETESDLIKALEFIQSCKNIEPIGFMTMAPFTNDEVAIRKSFRTLVSIQNKMQNRFSDFKLSELSMGMTNDFEIAIEEGSTLVRIGTAIFGARA